MIERVNDIERRNLVWLNSDTTTYSSNKRCHSMNLHLAYCPRTHHPTTETTTGNADTSHDNSEFLEYVISSASQS